MKRQTGEINVLTVQTIEITIPRCKIAEESGIFLLHGAGHAFTDHRAPMFKAVYQTHMKLIRFTKFDSYLELLRVYLAREWEVARRVDRGDVCGHLKEFDTMVIKGVDNFSN